MSENGHKSDLRKQDDQEKHIQTDKPWKGNPEKEQRNEADVDLERWQGTRTH